MIRHDITSADGTRLAVFDTGLREAPAILMMHGWSQHHLSFARQFDSALVEDFRLIVPDLRGHGASDKPESRAAYDNSEPWAADVAAIIDMLDLDQPVLVGWSMGGWIVQDYLRIHGAGHISGVMLIGTSATTGPYVPDDARNRREIDPDVAGHGMYVDEHAANLDATLAFVKACFALQPAPDDLARMIGFNMMVPPAIRDACRRRAEDYRPVWAALDGLPTALLWGSEERLALPSMIEQTRAAIPWAEAMPFAGCGHAPFWEDPDRFNASLGDFARRSHNARTV